MALRKLERRNYGGKSSVSIKYQNLHSFKEALILLCQSILEMRRITYLHGSAHFTIPLIRYKIISNKAVKLSSFLQCSVHVFLGHDGYFWKINLRISWNHIMKNFHVKHGQYDSIIFPKTFSFQSSK